MSEKIVNKSIEVHNIKESFWDKHKDFVGGVYTVAFYIGTVYAFFKWLVEMFNVAREGNVAGFLLMFFLQAVFQAISAFWFAIVWGTIGVVILIIPYLVIRGLSK